MRPIKGRARVNNVRHAIDTYVSQFGVSRNQLNKTGRKNLASRIKHERKASGRSGIRSIRLSNKPYAMLPRGTKYKQAQFN